VKEPGGYRTSLIIELGDGQVAGIPEKEDKNMFYKRLKERD
jgi:hypothetical protein